MSCAPLRAELNPGPSAVPALPAEKGYPSPRSRFAISWSVSRSSADRLSSPADEILSSTGSAPAARSVFASCVERWSPWRAWLAGSARHRLALRDDFVHFVALRSCARQACAESRAAAPRPDSRAPARSAAAGGRGSRPAAYGSTAIRRRDHPRGLGRSSHWCPCRLARLRPYRREIGRQQNHASTHARMGIVPNRAISSRGHCCQ